MENPPAATSRPDVSGLAPPAALEVPKADVVLTVGKTHLPKLGALTNPDQEAQIREATRATLEKHGLSQDGKRPVPIMGGADATEETQEDEEDDTPVREDVESIVVETDIGQVFLQPNKAITYRVALITAGDRAANTLAYAAKALLAVRTVDGRPFAGFSTKMQLLQLMEQWGDEVIDQVTGAYYQTWPSITAADLRIVKKNLRPA